MGVDTWELPWSRAYFGYTGIIGKDLAGMDLTTVIIYDNRELLITVTNILPKPLQRVTL